MKNNSYTTYIHNAIKKRCSKATPGPWIAYIEGRDHDGGESVIKRGVNWDEEDLYLYGATIDDYEFISHARQDIPILLNEIERLRSLLENIK